jgi:LacI family transcriptional regulator
MAFRKITLQQIADRLGVSKYTVSQAISGKPGVSESTRRLVLETAKSMGYRQAPAIPVNGGRLQSGSAADFTDGESQSAASASQSGSFIVIWIPYRDRNEMNFWQRVLSGIVAACDERKWEHVVLSPYDEQSKAVVLPPYLDATRCAGGLAIGSFPLTTIAAMVRTNLPVVLIDHNEGFADLDVVVNNNIEAAYSVIARMTDSGCKNLLFVGADSFSVSFRERWWGCKMAAEERLGQGKAVTLRKWSIPYTDQSWGAAVSRKLERLHADEWPDGIIGANDDIALELLAILERLGIAVPDKCKVAGFDNIRSAAGSKPPLTTVDLGKEELGSRAVEALERRIELPDRPRERIALSPRLIIRSSC